MDKRDFTLLVINLLRPILWMVGIWLTVTYRNWFALIGCVLSLFTSIPIAFELAGFSPPYWMVKVASLIATPAVMFIVAGIAYSRRNYKTLEKWAEDFPHLFEGRKEDLP